MNCEDIGGCSGGMDSRLLGNDELRELRVVGGVGMIEGGDV